MRRVTRTLKRLAGDNLAEWMPDTPHAAGSGAEDRARRSAGHLLSRLHLSRNGTLARRARGPLPDGVDGRVGRRAGVPLHIPRDVAGTCCGTPFSSKGFSGAHAITINAAIERFWKWSEQGRLPIVIDTSPCTYGFKTARSYLTEENQERFDQMTLVDAIEFVHDQLLPKLPVKTKSQSVACIRCARSPRWASRAKLEAIAHACSEQVTIPLDAGCCGFAGDRGFLFPELTAGGHQARSGRGESQAAGRVLLQQPHLRDRHEPLHGTDLPFVYVSSGESYAVG